MKTAAASLFLVLLSLLATQRALLAHHGSNAYYDSSKPLTLTGTVTEFLWTNPHVQIYFDVKDEQGKVTHWSCESNSPGKLRRAGWTRTTIKPGDQITITLAPARNGSQVGLAQKLVVNGKEVTNDETPY